MKREGRQHGTVRTYPLGSIPPHSARYVNISDSPPTAGFFTRVGRHPTNHSKFTGKCCKPRCNGCHLHPCCKSKEKTKGNQKVKSFDVVSNCKLITWRATRVEFSGFSASGMLDHLDSEFVDDEEIQGDYDEYRS